MLSRSQVKSLAHSACDFRVRTEQKHCFHVVPSPSSPSPCARASSVHAFAGSQIYLHKFSHYKVFYAGRVLREKAREREIEHPAGVSLQAGRQAGRHRVKSKSFAFDAHSGLMRGYFNAQTRSHTHSYEDDVRNNLHAAGFHARVRARDLHETFYGGWLAWSSSTLDVYTYIQRLCVPECVRIVGTEEGPAQKSFTIQTCVRASHHRDRVC